MWFNPMITWLLRSPLHGMISKNLMLITVTGRRSGKEITTPVNYFRSGNTIWVVSWRARYWWRNLRGGAAVRVELERNPASGQAFITEEEEAVARELLAYYKIVPQNARFTGISLDADGQPKAADCRKAAKRLVLVKIEL